MKTGRTKRSREIRSFLIDAVRLGRADIVHDASEQFGISRQAVHRHLSALTKEGLLEAVGTTRARSYRIGPLRRQRRVYELAAISEDRVYTADFAYIVDGRPKNVRDIWHYGFTEILNNAIDHSGGQRVVIHAAPFDEQLVLLIADDGEGIFKRIARLMDLHDPREAILELSKGKLTTDPENHTGEGIFFTSRLFDGFFIVSGDLSFGHLEDSGLDLMQHLGQEAKGTQVYMLLEPRTERTLESVFAAFTDSQTLEFSKTVVPVRLVLYEGDQLMSRSQAKRIMNRVERFQKVMLDFEGVDTVGRSFVDEIFRVFVNRHPTIELHAVNMNPRARREVERITGPQPADAD